MVGAQHAVTQKLTPQELIESARSSTDGIFIRETINRIEECPIPQDEKEGCALSLGAYI